MAAVIERRALAPGAYTLVHTVADGKSFAGVLTLANGNGTGPAALCRIAVTAGAAPVQGDHINVDTPVPIKGGVLARGLPGLPAGSRIYARAHIANVECVLTGEEA